MGGEREDWSREKRRDDKPKEREDRPRDNEDRNRRDGNGFQDRRREEDASIRSRNEREDYKRENDRRDDRRFKADRRGITPGRGETAVGLTPVRIEEGNHKSLSIQKTRGKPPHPQVTDLLQSRTPDWTL